MNNNKSTLPAALYIVSTPIGNKKDITLRALEILEQVDFIAAEDTRHSGLLMQEYGIKAKFIPLHDHNEQEKSHLLIDKLLAGDSIALISDAGTPLINDPGYHLVKQCHQNQIKVVPIPGACAAIAALSVSGLPTNKFSYEGFLPAKSKGRRDYLSALTQSDYTMIFYESTHRLKETLSDMQEIFGTDRTLVLAKELTKAWETVIQATINEVIQWLEDDPLREKGEFILIIKGVDKESVQSEISPEADQLLSLLAQELPLKKACEIVSKQYGFKKNMLYQMHIDNKD